MATLTISTIDRLSKSTSMALGVADAITNLNAQAIADAVDSIILGSAVRASVTVPNVVDAGSAIPPTDKAANRGNKWLLRFQDSTTGKIYTNEIGTADDAQLPSATNDYLDLSAGVGLALKTALDAEYLSPVGNAGVLLSVQQVNRGLN